MSVLYACTCRLSAASCEKNENIAKVVIIDDGDDDDDDDEYKV